jgi:hypothetical protein
MDAIERAKAHFNNQEIKSMEVEEWSDESGPLVIYAKPLTLNETQKLYKLAKDDDLALLAYAIINKALNADGEKLFTLDNKQALMNNVDVAVLTKIGTWIMGTIDVDEAVEK